VNYNGYDSYLEDWEAPIHPSTQEELTPLNQQEFNALTELTEREETALEEYLMDVNPLSNLEYINLLDDMSETNDKLGENV